MCPWLIPYATYHHIQYPSPSVFVACSLQPAIVPHHNGLSTAWSALTAKAPLQCGPAAWPENGRLKADEIKVIDFVAENADIWSVDVGRFNPYMKHIGPPAITNQPSQIFGNKRCLKVPAKQVIKTILKYVHKLPFRPCFVTLLTLWHYGEPPEASGLAHPHRTLREPHIYQNRHSSKHETF